MGLDHLRSPSAGCETCYIPQVGDVLVGRNLYGSDEPRKERPVAESLISMWRSRASSRRQRSASHQTLARRFVLAAALAGLSAGCSAGASESRNNASSTSASVLA